MTSYHLCVLFESKGLIRFERQNNATHYKYQLRWFFTENFFRRNFHHYENRYRSFRNCSRNTSVFFPWRFSAVFVYTDTLAIFTFFYLYQFSTEILRKTRKGVPTKFFKLLDGTYFQVQLKFWAKKQKFGLDFGPQMTNFFQKKSKKI